jgi:plastocyanin
MLIPLLAWLTIWCASIGDAPIDPSSARRHVVEMREFEFKPAVIRVTAGDTIVWVNRDVVPHTATAKPQWDTGTVGATASGSVVTGAKGEVKYVCVFHHGMTGTLVVE